MNDRPAFPMLRGLLFLLLFVFAVAPVSGDGRFRNLTMADGLQANTVRSMVQDADGFIWMGTDNGLSRYDGVMIRSFRNPENGVDQYVSCLLAASQGLYVGTGHGAFFFDFMTEQFRRIVPDLRQSISSFAADRDGSIWITSFSDSVICYFPDGNRPLRYRNPVGRTLISKVFVDQSNQVWLYTSSKTDMLLRFNKATGQFQTVATGIPASESGCYAMTQTVDGHLWLGTWAGGLYRLDNAGNRAEPFLNPHVQPWGSHIHHLSEGADHHLFVSCDDGLYEFDPQNRSWVQVVVSADHPQSINNRFVYSSFVDSEGGLWFSTFYGGVNYVSPVSERFASYQNGEGSGGLQGNVIGRFCEDADGRIWIASDDGGLNCFRDGNFLDFPARQRFSKLNIHALCIDGHNLWIGTYDDGIFSLNVATGQMVHYTSSDGLAGNSCYSLFRDRKGDIWATTMHAVCRFNRQQSKFQQSKEIGALTIDIDEDADGDLWFSTQGGGIWRLCQKQGRWVNYRHRADDPASLPSNQINCLSITADGRIWVGTESGFCLYDRASDSFQPQHLDAPSTDVRCMIEDGQFLWLSTAKGIVRYNKLRDVLIFNRYDGLVSEQFQPNSGLKASDGRIYFGSVRGFNAFYPYQIRVNTMPPKVFITGLKIYNHDVPVGEKPLLSSLAHTAQLDLSYRDDWFLLSFASLSYCSPEKNQYAYMLDGLDKEWNYTGNRSEASYTNVPSGTYTFRVRATNNDGVWSTDEARLKIVVHPPFWLSWPAKLLYILLALMAIYGYTHFRLRKAERRHRQELKHLGEEAEAEARDARLQFFTMIAHEIRTPVSLIIGPLETLKQKLGAHDHTLPPHDSDKASENDLSGMQSSLQIIDRNAHRLLTLVNQLLDFNKIQQQALVMHFAQHGIAPIMQSVAERFEPSLQQKGVRLLLSYPPETFTAMVDEEGLTKVISNLMANAAKYTDNIVRLSCRIAPDGSHFSIIVEDNGIGISDTDKQKIFDAFYQARDNKPGTGLGLSIVKTIVDQHHGSVQVESPCPPYATRFVVTLPQSQAALEAVPSPSSSGEQSALASQSASTAPASHENSSPSVLIVDDDADMLSFLSSHFAPSYNVFTAANGREGIKQLSHHAISLIISDWMMPEMNGAEFCRHLRSQRETSHIPLIMLTAKTDDDSKAESMNIGADAYIEKPFSLKYLDATIRNLINRRRRLMQHFSQTPDEPIQPLATNAIDNEILSRMNEIIEANIANSELSVGFLAEQMNMSRSGLFAKIKAIADVTPNEMIQVVRLKRAAQLLAEGKYRVNEVSYMVGFSSPSYFAKCFQKQFGIKPGEAIAQNMRPKEP